MQQVQLEKIQTKKNGFYVLQFPPQNERPVWTYITLGMSNKTMVNGIKVELIWLNDEENKEILDVMMRLTQYPFVEGNPYDYGHTISNSEPVSAFRMNTLLICPPIIEAADSTQLLDFFEKQKTELLWLLPIHPSEKEFIQKNEDFSCFFDLWMEKDISPEFLCNPNRSLII
ncbi:hypothetical protein QFZ31_002267 [Neobacillus niacini]|nr:hypothetical protein [Neobacillus niacini]